MLYDFYDEKKQNGKEIASKPTFGGLSHRYEEQMGTLIIEEDTIYEIDEECLNCHPAKYPDEN